MASTELPASEFPEKTPLQLQLLIDHYSVLRLSPDSTPIAALSSILLASRSRVSTNTALFNFSFSPTELSMVLPTHVVLDHGERWHSADLKLQVMESGWMALRVEPPVPESETGEESESAYPPGIDFSVVGIMARISGLLARARVSIFAVSTYDTDYILVKEMDVGTSVRVLREDGVVVRLEEPGSERWASKSFAGLGQGA